MSIELIRIMRDDPTSENKKKANNMWFYSLTPITIMTHGLCLFGRHISLSSLCIIRLSY